MSTDTATHDSDVTADDSLATLRLNIRSQVLWGLMILGAFPLVAFLVDACRDGTYGRAVLFATLYGVGFTVTVLKQLSAMVRTVTFLFVLYVASVSVLWSFGMASTGSLFFFAFIVYTGVFFGFRAGVVSTMLGMVTVVGIGYLYLTARVPITSPQQALSLEIQGWVTPGLILLFLSTTTLASVNLLLRDLSRTMQASQKYASDLRAENAERRGIEEALRESEERFRSLIESAATVVMLISPDRRILTFNIEAERLFERKRDETIGADFLETCVSEADKEPISELIDRALEGEALVDIENGVITSDGVKHTLAWYGNRVLDSQRQPAGVVIVGVDITRRKRLEDQLRQAQKMEAIGNLAGGVAHDFNNVLQVILGYSDLILNDLPSDDGHRSELEDIHEAAIRASDLTRQLLAFSRRQVMQPVDLDLNDLIANLMKMVRRLIGEDIDLDIMEGHRLGTIYADPAQMEQVIMNLCVNARDAMPEGGKLTIETENVDIGAEYAETHPWATPGQYVQLSVTDTGCGIDQDTQNQVFEPFFTTKGPGKGTGLGLATVYGTVKQHDGMVQVYSEIGKGTRFKIYLPIVERSAKAVTVPAPDPAPGGTETILVAEDEETVRHLTIRFLEKAGYTVLVAEDGEEALRLFEARADEIDLVLLDVVMPKLGGRGVMERIHDGHPEARILFCSGYSENAVHTNFILDEGLQLIQKPYDPDTLLRRIRETLDS